MAQHACEIVEHLTTTVHQRYFLAYVADERHADRWRTRGIHRSVVFVLANGYSPPYIVELTNHHSVVFFSARARVQYLIKRRIEQTSNYIYLNYTARDNIMIYGAININSTPRLQE